MSRKDRVGFAIKAGGLFFLSLVFNVLVLFHEKLPAVIVTLASVLFVLIFFWQVKKYVSKTQSLFLLAIVLIPSSFVSVIGTSYTSLPISWFTLCITLLFVVILRSGKMEKRFLVALLMFAMFALVSIANVEHTFSAVKQIINISVFMLSFVVGSYLSVQGWSMKFFNFAKLLYVQTAIIFAGTVIVQKLFIEATGEVIGRYGEYALGRVSYAGLMGDFSFASLYIATGCIALLFAYYEKNIRSLTATLMGGILLIISMIIINARTGVLALGVSVVVGMFIAIIKGNKKGITFGVLASIIILISGFFIYNNRGEQSFTDGSGRNDEYSLGIQIFTEHPIAGIGFGDDNYKKYLGDVPLPHNFFVQYLMQAGLIGLSVILLSFMLFLRLPITRDKGLLLILMAISCGSMLVPDILNSRYLFVIIAMSIIGCGSYAYLKKRQTV